MVFGYRSKFIMLEFHSISALSFSNCSLYAHIGIRVRSLLKNTITSYRAFDLENGIDGGSHIKVSSIYAIPVPTKHDRGSSTVMAESNEEKKNFG